MNQQDLEQWIDYPVCGTDGDKLGKVANIYVDDATEKPEWLALHTGMFGLHTSFVPITGAKLDGETVVVPFTSDQVKDAPRVDPNGSLSQDEEAELYAHYGLNYSEAPSSSGLPTGAANTAPAGHDTSGPNTDDAMTRSEEELHVGKTTQESGKVRLRKYLVTEQQNVSVPVSHEEVRIEREAITDANIGDALDGPALSEEEHEVTLHEEVPVVTKKVVPKERVSLGTETVTTDESVSADLTREQIEVENKNK